MESKSDKAKVVVKIKLYMQLRKLNEKQVQFETSSTNFSLEETAFLFYLIICTTSHFSTFLRLYFPSEFSVSLHQPTATKAILLCAV